MAVPSRAATSAISLALLCASTATGVTLALHSRQFVDRLNRDDTTLADSGRAESTVGRPLAERVVLVIADGLTVEASRSMPMLQALANQGVSGIASSHLPTISRPNFAAIVTGVPPAASGVRTNDCNRRVELDSIMRRVRASGASAGYVSDSSSGFATMFSHHLDRLAYSPWEGGYVRAAKAALTDGHRLVILLPGEIDKVGHAHGSSSRRYLEAARTVDSHLAAILATVNLERDAVIVVADHGHTARGGHGGDESIVVRVPLIMAGRGVRSGASGLRSPRLIDIAPTVAVLLGVEMPGHGFGRALTEALTIDSGTADRLASQADAIAERSRSIAAFAERVARQSEARKRVRSYLILAIGVVFLVVVAMIVYRRGLGDIDRCSALVATAALPVLAGAWLVSFSGPVSLSALPHEDVLRQRVSIFLFAVPVCTLLLFTAVCRRAGFAQRRLSAANGLAIPLFGSTLVSGGLIWAHYNDMSFASLPHPAELVVAPIVLVTGSAIAFGVAAALFFELLLYVNRRRQP